MSTEHKVDVVAARRAQFWTLREKIGRVLWVAVWPAFRLSPRIFWGWRRFMLRLFGAQVGQEVHIYPSVKIIAPWNLSFGNYAAVGDGVNLYALGPITIGARATISQGSYLCSGSHDWRDPAMPLINPPVVIGDEAWICAEAFVGPGVTIGARTILGARGVAMRDLPPNVLARGNPVQILGPRDRDPVSSVG